MNEAVLGLRTNLAVKNIRDFSFSNDGKSYLQMVKNAYLITDIATNKSDTLVSLYQVNQNLSADQKLKALSPLKFLNNSKAYFSQKGKYFWLQKTGNSWQKTEFASIPEEAENAQLLPDNQTIIYTIKNNLFVNVNGKTLKITDDQNENIINGQSVHRNEFGIDGGIFAAPNFQKIAFYRMDQSMVTDYPIIDWSVTPAENHNMKYPMAGNKSHEVSIGVFDVKTQTKKFLNIEGDKEQYLTSVTWSPDSKFIFVAVLNRAQNHMKLNQYNAETGNLVKTLFEEKDEKYVEPQHPLTFLPGSNKDFIWQSQRTGYNHLFWYNTDKGLVKQITKGDWLVNEILGFNEKKKEIYFSSTKETPLEKHLYKVNWQTTKITRLDKDAGIHNGILSKDGTHLYDVFANASTPRIANIINTQSLQTKNILTAENPLKSFQRPEIQNMTLKADDGTPLYGKLILPTDFDKTKKYPVIVYLYNGPHLQLVTNNFPASGNLWYEYMAQRGYIVFTMDGRGSSNRGTQFEQAVFRNLGETEMKDQLKGVEYLKSLPFVNAEKMGIHGWSFGGFMTTSFMLKYPEFFKAGVAGGPVIDWTLYEIMYTERYMDTPKENPEGYAKANLLDKVQNLKG